jgi:hypothetical protein
VVVVDNASHDGSVEFLQKLRAAFPELQLHLNGTNLGVGGGRNVGFRAARGQYILYLDDDTLMEVADIVKLPLYFQTHCEAGILAFRVWDILSGRYLNDFGETPCSDIANFAGAGHAIRAELFRRIGYLDELCTFGAEELDFSIRAHSAGFTTVYLPRPIVLHYNKARAGRLLLERRERYLYNFIRVLFKHFPIPLAGTFAFRLLSSHIRAGIKNHGIRVIMSLCICAYTAIKAGLDNHTCVSIDTIRFYRRPDLLPDYGNIPIMKKILSA